MITNKETEVTPKTTEEIIKEFLTQMATQCNRSTAAPYYYVIRDEEEYQCDVRNADKTEVHHEDSNYQSMEQMEEQLKEDGYEPDAIKKMLREAEEYGVSTRWIDKGMFLTEIDAKNHLKCNYYHYSKKAHTYVCHAWRAHYLDEFMKALFTHFKVDEGNYKINL